MDGSTGEWTSKWTDGRMDGGRTDGWMDGSWTDGWMGARDDSVVSGWVSERLDGLQEESPMHTQAESHFLWLSVSVIPWAETLK